MRSLIKVATCTILMTIAAPAEAQILGRITKRATDAVEKKAEEKLNAKLDQMAQKLVDNSFDAVFGEPESGSGEKAASGSGAKGGLPFSIGSGAKTEERYTFSLVTTLEIEAFKRGDRSDGKALLKMHFNPNEAYTGTSITSADAKEADGSAFIVLDAKNSAMVMLMESDKDKFSIAYDWKEALKYAEAANARTEPVNWDTVQVWHSYTRIGTRTIHGHTAHGYRAESPESTVEIWVTRDAVLRDVNLFASGASMKPMKGKLPADYPYGMMLEMTSVSKNSGEKVVMKVTEINTSARVAYAMSDYPRMEMGKK